MNPSYLRVSLFSDVQIPHPPTETTPLAGAPAVSLPLGAPSAALAAPGAANFGEKMNHLVIQKWIVV